MGKVVHFFTDQSRTREDVWTSQQKPEWRESNLKPVWPLPCKRQDTWKVLFVGLCLCSSSDLLSPTCLPGPGPFAQWIAVATTTKAHLVTPSLTPHEGWAAAQPPSHPHSRQLSISGSHAWGQQITKALLLPFQTQVKYCSLDMRCSFPKSCLEKLFDNNQKCRQTFNNGSESSVFICQTGAKSVIYQLVFAYLLPWLMFPFLSFLSPWDHSGLSLIWIFCHTIYLLDRLRHLVPKTNSSKEWKRGENPNLNLKLKTNSYIWLNLASSIRLGGWKSSFKKLHLYTSNFLAYELNSCHIQKH